MSERERGSLGGERTGFLDVGLLLYGGLTAAALGRLDDVGHGRA